MLYIGADHNGYHIKEKLKTSLTRDGVKWQDCGAFEYDKNDDYPDFSTRVAKSLGPKDLGLLICGSGHGMVIAANKMRGARSVLPLSTASAEQARREDWANILVLAAREHDFATCKKILRVFLRTKPGTKPRYVRRLKKIRKLE